MPMAAFVHSPYFQRDRYSVSIEKMTGMPFHKEVKNFTEEVLDFFCYASIVPNLHVTLGHRPLGGRMRMGEQGKSIVDTSLRFHKYDNLFCCDLSVFPDIPASNPPSH
ncbi:GMC oxidoreductase [Ancylobacter aquaticus]|uniref:GMC oxidoreductase n=1 Tax=Ancylobacter aquaticus TaxID=100 RepID=UPI001A9E19DA